MPLFSKSRIRQRSSIDASTVISAESASSNRRLKLDKATAAAVEPLESRIFLSTTIAPSDDAFTYQYTPTQNYGGDTSVRLRNSTGGHERWGWLKFPISSIASVESAKLRLYGWTRLYDNDPSTAIINVSSRQPASSFSWQEGTITWNSHSGVSLTSASDSQAVTGTTEKWWEWNVGPLVAAAKSAGQTEITFVMKSDTANQSMAKFRSKDGGAASNTGPQLVVTEPTPTGQFVLNGASVSVNEGGSATTGVRLQSQPAGNVSVTIARTSGDSDLSATTSLTFTPQNWNTDQLITLNAAHDADASAGSATFTVSASGFTSATFTATEVEDDVLLAPSDDAYTYQYTLTQNYGSDTSIRLRNSTGGHERWGWLKFPISSIASVESATLRLYGWTRLFDNDPSTAIINVSSRQPAQPYSWQEGTITWQGHTNVQLTSPEFSQEVTGTVEKWWEWNVGPLVAVAKAAGQTEITIVMKSDTANQSMAKFRSKEGGLSTGTGPQLLVIADPTPQPPAAPSNLTATAVSSSQVNLAWTDNSNNETGFKIDRSIDPAFPTGLTQTFTVAADATTYPTTGLTAGTTYYFRVRATGGPLGDSANTGIHSAATLGALGITHDAQAAAPEGTPITFTASYAGAGAPPGTTYNWTVRRNGQFFASQTAGGASFAVTPTDEGAYSASVIALTPAGGEDAATTAADVAVQNVDPTLTVNGNATAGVNAFYWLDLLSADPGSDDVITWSIDWGDGQTESPAPVGRNLAISHQYTAADSYVITVTGGDGTATGVAATPATIAVDVTGNAPAAPTNAAVALASPTEALLTWTAATGDPDSYYIYASSDGGDFELYDVTSASNTSYRFFSVSTVSVMFRISAINRFGESVLVDVAAPGGYTVAVNASFISPPQTFYLSGQAYTDDVPLSWSSVSDATGYVVEWSNGGDEWFIIGDTSATSFTDDYPGLGQQQYRIRAYRRTIGSEYSEPTASTLVHPIAPPVAWYDDNAGPNEQGTLSPFTTIHDREYTFSVVPNDIDYESSPITIPANAFTQPEHGTISLNEASGEFTYVPNEKYIGTDTFTYWVNDGTINSEPATVAIDVTNRAPIPGGSQVYQYEAWHQFGVNQPLVGSIGAADDDEDSLTYRIDNAPEHGTLDLNAATGAFSYTVDGTFFGFDRFTVIPTDGITDGAPISVSVWSEMPLVFYFDYRFTGSTFVQSHYFPETYLSRAPLHGSLHLDGQPGQPVPQPSGYDDGWKYTPHDTWNPQRDSFEYYGKRGGRTSKPATVYVIDPAVDVNPLYIDSIATHVLADAPSTDSLGINSDTGFWQGWGGTVSVGVQPTHGQVQLDPQTGAYTFTPNKPAEGERPYLGWDFFRVDAIEPTSEARQQWIQLFVGLEQLGPSTLAAHTPPILQATEGDIAPTKQAIAAGVTHAKNLLTALFADLATLGEGVGDVSTAADDQILSKLDVATGNIDRIASQYDEYVTQVAKLGKALGRFLANQYYISDADTALAASVNLLPLTVGSLKASNDQMKKLADSLASQGEGASIAVETAGKVVTYAENTHKVLTAVQMAGGVGALVQTGATILTQQTLKACAVKAGVAALQWTASATAAAAGNFALSYLPLSESQRYWLKIGLDAYQIFAFFKAAKAKVKGCFVAGTQVAVALDVNGIPITREIEALQPDDLVLARDERDAGDELEQRRVTAVSRRTVYALQHVELADGLGNREHLQTTPEHPFYVVGKGWLEAAGLQAGDIVYDESGTGLTVAASWCEDRPEGIEVFNLTVEGDHTYFVEDGIGTSSLAWVHNSGDLCNIDWRKFTKPIAKIMKRWGGPEAFRCKEIAADMSQLLKSQGVAARQLDVNAAGSTGPDFGVSYLIPDGRGGWKEINLGYMHRVTEADGKIFDSVFPQGIARSVWDSYIDARGGKVLSYFD